MDRNLDLDFAVSRTGVFVAAPGDLARELDADLIGDDLLRFLYFEAPWQTTAVTWRRATLKRLGGWDEALPSWQDVDLHVRAIAKGLRYMRLPAVVDHHMRWQEHPDKVSTQQHRSPAHLRAAVPLLTKLEQAVRQGPGMSWVRQRALCSLYFSVAERWIDAANLTESLACWREIKRRNIGPVWLHLTGAAVLALRVLSKPAGERIGHKWKGWARLRTNPELVANNLKNWRGH